MTIPQVTPLPPAPNRRQSRNDYPITADTWAAALGPYTDQLNAFAAELNPLVPSLAAAGPNAARAEAAAQQAQTYAAAAGAAAGVPALVGNKGKALVVSQDEKTVQFGDVGQKIGDILITANDPGATYLPANGSVFGQSNFPELFKKIGIIGDTINADYKAGWNVPGVPALAAGRFAYDWNSTYAYNGKGIALRVVKVFGSGTNAQYFYVERLNFPADSTWTKVSQNIILASNNQTYRRAGIAWLGGSIWAIATADAKIGTGSSSGSAIWVSKDDGVTWNIAVDPTASGMNYDFNAIASNGKGFAVAYQQAPVSQSLNVQAYVTEDFGITWRSVEITPYTSGAYNSVGEIVVDDVGDLHVGVYRQTASGSAYVGTYFRYRIRGGAFQLLNTILTGRTIASSSESDTRTNYTIRIFVGASGRVIINDNQSTNVPAKLLILNLSNSSILATPTINPNGGTYWLVNYSGTTWIASTKDSSNGATISGKWLWISTDDGASWSQMNVSNFVPPAAIAAFIGGVIYFSISGTQYRLETSTSYDKAVNFVTPNMQIPAGQVIKAYIKAKES